MDRIEALNYFSKEEIDDLKDSYEEKLFSFKQYFIHKPPITKTYQAKLKKLKLLNDAFVTLGGKVEKLESTIVLPILSSDVKELFNQFNQTRSQIKIQIQDSVNGIQLHSVIRDYLCLMRDYVKVWSDIDIDYSEDVKVSVELDAMEMLKAINSFNSKGFSTINDIIHLDDNDLLIQEAKRLYLWNKLDIDV